MDKTGDDNNSSYLSDEPEDFNDSSSDNGDETGIALTIESNGTGTSANFNDHFSDYKILTEDQVYEEMNRIANETSAVIHYSPSICRTLLKHFKWNKETLLERFYEALDSEKFFRGASLLNPSFGMLISQSSKLCKICYDSQILTGLQCGHLFCDECWRGYLTCKIVNEGCPHISCPEFKCNTAIDDDTVMGLINNSEVKRAYQKLVLKSFILSNSMFTWCPGVNCGNIVKVPHSEPQPIHCECGTTFCFQCADEWHEPVHCLMLKRWRDKCNGDSETANWLNANTKDCPKCHITIEKDGGCNHMTCKNVFCRFEFCWTCLGSWEPHGSGWYSCNRFDDDTAKKTRFEQNKSRSALQRYLHYYNRFSNHHNSLKLENKLYTQVTTKMEQMQQHNFSWIETQFLKKAVDVLSECRRTLMFTYVFAFYLLQSNITKIFEDNQQDLELATEQLSEFLERDLEYENLVTLKQKVQDKYRYVEQRRTLLLKHCAEGYEANQWLFKKESSSELIVHNNNYDGKKK